MAKRSTPKKRQAKSQSRRRYKTFQNKARKRLIAQTSLGKCPKCKEMKLSHTACPTCGFYKGKPVIDKEKQMEKITKVKA
jgi:large subunit ribosomal protein L32